MYMGWEAEGSVGSGKGGGERQMVVYISRGVDLGLRSPCCIGGSGQPKSMRAILHSMSRMCFTSSLNRLKRVGSKSWGNGKRGLLRQRGPKAGGSRLEARWPGPGLRAPGPGPGLGPGPRAPGIGPRSRAPAPVSAAPISRFPKSRSWKSRKSGAQCDCSRLASRPSSRSFREIGKTSKGNYVVYVQQSCLSKTCLAHPCRPPCTTLAHLAHTIAHPPCTNALRNPSEATV